MALKWLMLNGPDEEAPAPTEELAEEEESSSEEEDSSDEINVILYNTGPNPMFAPLAHPTSSALEKR